MGFLVGATGDLHIAYLTEEDGGDDQTYLCFAATWYQRSPHLSTSKIIINNSTGAPNPPALVYPTSSDKQTCIVGQRCVLRCFTKGMLVPPYIWEVMWPQYQFPRWYSGFHKFFLPCPDSVRGRWTLRLCVSGVELLRNFLLTPHEHHGCRPP